WIAWRERAIAFSPRAAPREFSADELGELELAYAGSAGRACGDQPCVPRWLDTGAAYPSPSRQADGQRCRDRVCHGLLRCARYRLVRANDGAVQIARAAGG